MTMNYVLPRDYTMMITAIKDYHATALEVFEVFLELDMILVYLPPKNEIGIKLHLQHISPVYSSILTYIIHYTSEIRWRRIVIPIE